MLIGDILSMNAQRCPDKIALRTKEGGRTFGQLEWSANRIANVLIGMGVQIGRRVAVIEKTSHSCIETTFGIAKSGGILVNINNLLKAGELRKILKDCDPWILIFGRDYENLVKEIQADFPGISHYLSIGPSSWAPDLKGEMENAPDTVPSVGLSEEDTLLLLYTAGTTGNPKAAVCTHGAFSRNLFSVVIDTYKQTYHDTWMGPIPMYHVGGYATLLRALLMSNTFILKDKFDPLDYLRTIERERVTILYAYPTMINAMVNRPEAGNFDFSSLRLVIYGGSPIPLQTIEKAVNIFKCDFLQRYGGTECCGAGILTLTPEHHRSGLQGTPEARKRLQSAGQPSLAAKVRIVNENMEQIIVPGEVGLLETFLEAPMKEYWRSPEETRAVLREGWLTLGDMAKFDEDGFFYLVDRAKDMIVSGARNIYPREVEEVLYSHPAVEEAAVIGVPDDYWGEAVKAVVALKAGADLTEEELIHYCKQHLAGYKSPKSVDFVDALPKNPGGKILKKELRKKYWEGRDRYVH